MAAWPAPSAAFLVGKGAATREMNTMSQRDALPVWEMERESES